MPTKKSRRRQTVWVVVHCEIVHGDHVDSMQAHVSSTLKAAVAYLSAAHVQAFSWWQVHSYVIDAEPIAELSRPEVVQYFSHIHKPLKSPPVKQAIKAFAKAKEKNPELFDCPCCE